MGKQRENKRKQRENNEFNIVERNRLPHEYFFNKLQYNQYDRSFTSCQIRKCLQKPIKTAQKGPEANKIGLIHDPPTSCDPC